MFHGMYLLSYRKIGVALIKNTKVENRGGTWPENMRKWLGENNPTVDVEYGCMFLPHSSSSLSANVHDI